jgi:hypothetical protein
MICLRLWRKNLKKTAGIMINLFLYLIKSGIILAACYALYRLFLERDTFFIMHRIILLFGIFLSIILPGVKYVLPFGSVTEFLPLNYLPERTPDITNVAPVNLLNISHVEFSRDTKILSIYLAGVLFFLIRLIIEVIKASWLIKRSKISTREGIRLIQVKEDYLPFSLFRTIFYNPSKTTQEDFEKIFVHEKAHIIQRHFVDILIAELLIILQWFNPFMWLYANVIKENHEYLADSAVTNLFSDKLMYQELLVHQSVGYKKTNLTNDFNRSVKKRILMITKNRSAPILRAKVLILIPFIGILLFSFAQSPEFIAVGGKIATENQTYYRISGKVIEKETQKPIPGAVVLVAESTNGCITNSKGVFTFLVPHLDIELIFSYINHKDIRKVIRNQHPMTIYLESTPKTNQSVVQNLNSNDKSSRVKWDNDTTYTIGFPPFPANIILIVEGKIVQGNNKQAIAGGIISIKGQKSTVLSNLSGEFSIKIPEFNCKLNVTSEGHNQEIDMNNLYGICKRIEGRNDSIVFELKDLEL